MAAVVESRSKGQIANGRTMGLIVGDCGSHVQSENAGKGKVSV